MSSKTENLMSKIVALCKRRGFIFSGSEIYGGLSGTWDYGPLGVELKNNIKREWWRHFVERRQDIYGIDSAILMNAGVWHASGHVKNFSDPMVDCKKCKSRFRADKLDLKNKCPECGAKDFTEARPFNMMFKTYAGPVEDTASVTYLRPETAQGMFINFKNIVDSMHPEIPFGIAQIGKAFRNEITPGNFIFRTREFEQMEIEYFVAEDRWEIEFDSWRYGMEDWVKFLGLDESKVSYRDVPANERAHYSKKTIDVDFEFPFGREELYGLAYRTDFDLSQHAKESKTDLSYFNESTKTRFIPHVIEPTFGIDRTVLVLLANHYKEDGDRTILSFPPRLAPKQVAVFPLLSNKSELVGKAGEVYLMLKENFNTVWDDRGNIGKRYYAQDEIGTPWCVTIDHKTLEDDTVTVRDRDTTKQERMASKELASYFISKLNV